MDALKPVVSTLAQTEDERCSSIVAARGTGESDESAVETTMPLLEALFLAEHNNDDVSELVCAPMSGFGGAFIDANPLLPEMSFLTSSDESPGSEHQLRGEETASESHDGQTISSKTSYSPSSGVRLCLDEEQESLTDEGYSSVQGDPDETIHGPRNQHLETILEWRTGVVCPSESIGRAANQIDSERNGNPDDGSHATIEASPDAEDNTDAINDRPGAASESDSDQPDELEWVIQTLGDNKWLLGPSMLLKRYPVATSFCTWTDRDGSGYTLRQLKRSGDGFLLPLKYAAVSPQPYPLTTHGPIKIVKATAGHGVWRIGGWGYFKSLPWTHGMGTEDETLAYLEEAAPNIPVPRVYGSHKDPVLHRSYLLMSRMDGIRLNEAWFRMDRTDRADVVTQIADFVVQMANLESNLMVTAAKKTIFEPFLRKPVTDEDNPWRNLIDRTECRLYEKIWGKGKQNELVFQHGDLGPKNIKVDKDDDGRVVVTGIFDWEVAGFLPRGWIATKLMICGGMDLIWDHPGWVVEQTTWRHALAKNLGSRGFRSYGLEWSKWIGHRRFKGHTFSAQDVLSYQFPEVGREDEAKYW